MSDEILKDLNRVIEKYKDKVFCTGELNYVDIAKSCKLEIERLHSIIKEVREYIENYPTLRYSSMDNSNGNRLTGKLVPTDKILEILDKAGDEK